MILQRLSPSTYKDDEDFIYEMKRAVLLSGFNAPHYRSPRGVSEWHDLPDLLVAYDLRDPDAWQAARRHRALWGKLYTDIHALDYDHIALVFRPAPDERWRPWERARLEWILEDRERVA